VCENTIIKPTKNCNKGERETRKSNRGNEYGQNILYACMEISQ
jgi:hypothetical protein